jgi:glyoxylase-like metal-dependent hydrolase (beta-lactamase superfamily II)
MKEIARDLYLLRGFPPAGFNIYAIRSGERWLLVDTSTKYSRRRILRQLPGELEAIFITHAHRDHAGSMHAVATATGAPVWSSAADADAIEGTAAEPIPAQYDDHIVNRMARSWWTEHHPVSRRLSEGEEVAGFSVIEFPGHTPGQIGLWRESDQTVICADTMRSLNLVTGLPQLGEMPKLFTCDIDEARASIRKLAALEARTVCFGHGRPLTKNTTDRLYEFAAGLPVREPTPA